MVDSVPPTPSATRLQERVDLFGAKRHTVAMKLDTGLDPSEYAKAIGDVTRAEAKVIQNVVDKNLNTILKLKELKQKTAILSNLSQGLSNYLGANTDTPNLWTQKSLSVTNGTGQDVSGLIHITALNSANLQNFQLNVTQLATSDHIASTSTFGNAADGLTLSGNLVINGTTITVTDGTNGTKNMSLTDIQTAVNQALSSQGISMNLFTVDGTNYTWQLTHSKLSIPIDLTGTDSAILNGLFVPLNFNNNNLPSVTPLANLQLKCAYNGLNITRNGSNIIDDLILGVTIEVKSASVGPVQCTVDYDRVSLQQGFLAFAAAYNDVQDFYRAQTAYEDDNITPKSDSYLHQNNTLRSEMLALKTMTLATVPGLTSGTMTSLQNIGMSIGQDSSLDSELNSESRTNIFVDNTLLDQLLYGNQINQVLSVSGNQASSSNPSFRVFNIPDFTKAQSSALAGVPITLSVQNVNGTIQGTLSASINSTTVTATANSLTGGLFEGPENSPFQGLIVSCQTSVLNALAIGSSVSTTVTATQGIFASIGTLLDSYTTYQTGIIDENIKQLELENTMKILKVKAIEEKAFKIEEDTLQRLNRVRDIENSFKQMTQMMDIYVDMITSKN